jgi:hypothetical protein
LQARRAPTITPPSLVATVKPGLKILVYDSGPYMGFDESEDIYGDGTIVVVPGVFLKLGQRRVFLIGDVAVTLEAAERGQFLVQVQACVAPNYCTVGFCQPPGGVTFSSTSRGPQLPGS